MTSIFVSSQILVKGMASRNCPCKREDQVAAQLEWFATAAREEYGKAGGAVADIS